MDFVKWVTVTGQHIHEGGRIEDTKCINWCLGKLKEDSI